VLESLYSLVACAVIWLAVLGAGCPLVRRFRLATGDRLADGVWTAGLGLAATGWAFALLGFCGWLYPSAVGILTLVAAFWGLGELFCIALARRDAWRSGARSLRPATAGSDVIRERWAGRTPWLAALAATSTVALLIGALGPTTSPEALSQSLEVAKEISLSHSLAMPPLNTSTGGPALAELWFQWAWVFDGVAAASLLQWSLGLLTAAATALLARQILGQRAGFVAAALLLLAPCVQYQLVTAAGDLAATAFATLALAAWWTGTTRDAPGPWFAVAGSMLGTSLAVRPTSLGIAVAIVVATGWIVWLKPATKPAALRGLATVLTIAGALAGGWYLRGANHGNFTGRLSLHGHAAAGAGIVLLTLAAAALLLRPRHNVRCVALMVAAGIVSGVLIFEQQRWWVPLVPLLSIIAAYTWLEIAAFAPLPRRLAQATIAALVLAGLWPPLQIARDNAAVVCGLESRDSYLLGRHPEFAAVVLANRLVPAGGQLLADGVFGVYLHCRTLNATSYWRRHSDPNVGLAEAATQFRSHGITHVLVAQPECEPPVVPASVGDAQPEEGVNTVLPLADFRLTRQDASVWRYRLLQIR
jgi:hypothetical protein